MVKLTAFIITHKFREGQFMTAEMKLSEWPSFWPHSQRQTAFDTWSKIVEIARRDWEVHEVVIESADAPRSA